MFLVPFRLTSKYTILLRKLVRILGALGMGTCLSTSVADEVSPHSGYETTTECDGIYEVGVLGVPFDRVYRDTLTVSDVRRDFTFHHRYFGRSAEEICGEMLGRLSPQTKSSHDAEWAPKMVRVVIDFTYSDQERRTVFATRNRVYSLDLKEGGDADCRLHMLMQTAALMPKPERDAWASTVCESRTWR